MHYYMVVYTRVEPLKEEQSIQINVKTSDTLFTKAKSAFSK